MVESCNGFRGRVLCVKKKTQQTDVFTKLSTNHDINKQTLNTKNNDSVTLLQKSDTTK